MPLYAILILVFLGTASLLFALMYMFVHKKTVIEERLEGILPEQAEEVSYIEKPPTPWQKLLGRLGKQVPMRPEEYGKYTKRLVAAGIKKERLPVFMGIKVSLAVILPVLYAFIYAIPKGTDRLTLVTASAVFAILGFLLPSYQLSRMVRSRQQRIFHDLPDVLDLMTVCVEAGLSMEAAMLKISDDKQFRDSPLAKEMKVATQETRAGKPREEALRDMGERTLLNDFKSFTAMLIQTERLGTSLAQSLRIHSDSLRTVRRQRAEEAAAKTAIKLLFPLVFLIMPGIFVVMLMPALLRIIKLFSGMQ